MQPTHGAVLARLLLEALESMRVEVAQELAQRGHPYTTPTHHYAMEAIDAGASDVSALARSLGVTRQAAAKTISALEHLGYVERGADAGDARRRPLTVTARGHEMTRLGADAFERIRARIEASQGSGRLRSTVQVLRSISESNGPPGTKP